MSTPLLGSVQTMRVSNDICQPAPLTSFLSFSTLLLLKAIFLADPSLQQYSLGLILRLHDDTRLFLTADFVLKTRKSQPCCLLLVATQKMGLGASFQRCAEQRIKNTYKEELSRAEAGASIKPVIVTQLVDFDPLFVVRRIRHRLCHHQRL